MKSIVNPYGRRGQHAPTFTGGQTPIYRTTPSGGITFSRFPPTEEASRLAAAAQQISAAGKRIITMPVPQARAPYQQLPRLAGLNLSNTPVGGSYQDKFWQTGQKPTAVLPASDVRSIQSSMDYYNEPWKYSAAVGPWEGILARPGTTSPLPDDGGGGPGYYYPPAEKPVTDVEWSPTQLSLKDANAPGWWSGMVPKDKKDLDRPDVQALMIMNAMIPYMSPEDQRRAASYLYSATTKGFGAYTPDVMGTEAPMGERAAGLSETGAVPFDRQYFLSAARASGATDAMSQIFSKAGAKETGQAGAWMQQLLGVLGRYGGAPGQEPTRAKYVSMLGELDPLIAQGGQMGPLGALGEMLASPFFSRAQLVRRHQGAGGRFFFGAPNPSLF